MYGNLLLFYCNNLGQKWRTPNQGDYISIEIEKALWGFEDRLAEVSEGKVRIKDNSEDLVSTRIVYKRILLPGGTQKSYKQVKLKILIFNL